MSAKMSSNILVQKFLFHTGGNVLATYAYHHEHIPQGLFKFLLWYVSDLFTLAGQREPLIVVSNL